MPDVQIEVIQKVDLDEYQRHLDRTPNTKEWIAQEIDNVKRFKAMKPIRKVSLLLDAKHGYAVAERDEWTAAGQHIGHIVSEDWKFYDAPGIWLPGRCVASYYTEPYGLKDFAKEPVHTETHELKRVEFGTKEIAFRFDRPGNPLPR